MPKSQHDCPDVTVVAHPPERGGNGGVTLLCGACCCCCCCCCLHSVGSLVGGAVGSVVPLPRWGRRRDDADEFSVNRDDFIEDRAILPTGLLYWIFVSMLVAVPTLAGYVWAGVDQPEHLLFSFLIMVAAFMPLLQLVGSLFTLIGAFFYRDMRHALLRVGVITGSSLIGTVVGILVMVGALMMMGAVLNR
jgi:hypothetical protein